MKEIGSDFWTVELNTSRHTFTTGTDMRYLLSGRTALDYIIGDIKAKRKFETACLPSYCCHTMVEPFISNGISVAFYDVLINESGFEPVIDFNATFDVFYAIQYFGYSEKKHNDNIKRIKSTGSTVIEDATHSILSSNRYYEQSDYVFVSWRKWTGLECGAFACCMHESFKNDEEHGSNIEYFKLRNEAMRQKKLYIDNTNDSKDYLKTFRYAEELLEQRYKGFSAADEITAKIPYINYPLIKAKRFENAWVLLNELSGVKEIELIVKDISDDDCPLFVPVIVKNGMRDKLREFLTGNSVYCPVHWPLSKLHRVSREARFIYDNELSIICDQRYGKDDMLHIAGLIRGYFQGVDH